MNSEGSYAALRLATGDLARPLAEIAGGPAKRVGGEHQTVDDGYEPAMDKKGPPPPLKEKFDAYKHGSKYSLNEGAVTHLLHYCGHAHD